MFRCSSTGKLVRANLPLPLSQAAFVRWQQLRQQGPVICVACGMTHLLDADDFFLDDDPKAHP